MAMSDCIKCWSTPCECGWDYRNLPLTKRVDLACVILGIKPEELKQVDIPIEHPMKVGQTQKI